MASVKIPAIACVGLLLTACASSQKDVYSPPASAVRQATAAAEPTPIATQKIGRPYQVSGRWYTPARQDDYSATGQASWYGDEFHGRLTANGEIFDMNALTAAHPTLPIPSYVQVTNLDNGRIAVLRVNDRGPFARGRILDVSRRAAEELGFRSRGVANVRVTYLGPKENELGAPRLYTAADTQAPASARPAVQRSDPALGGGWFIQAGAFSQEHRADNVVRRLGGVGPTRTETVSIAGRTLHRVLVGPYGAETEARQARYQVASAGFRDARLVERN